MSLAALPMEPPFDTPLQPLSEAQLQVQTFALQVSAVPCVKVYPSAHAVVWLLLGRVLMGAHGRLRLRATPRHLHPGHNPEQLSWAQLAVFAVMPRDGHAVRA